jgi:Lectin C-type domain
MRILITLLSIAAGACYSPGVEDCQFRCGAGNACPAGTSCEKGLCRSGTGSCPMTIDACLAAPSPPAGCGPKLSIDGAAACGTVCPTRRSWSAARMDCDAAGWQLAILDSPAKLASVPMGPELYWVGANRATSTSPWLWIDDAPVAADAWTSGPPRGGEGEDCAILGGMTRKLSNTSSCNGPERFLCTYRP